MSSSGRTHLLATRVSSHVRWRVVEIDPDANRARLVPYLAHAALTDLLDAAYGVTGWANRFRSFGADAVGGELDVGGIVKAAVVRAGPGPTDPAELAAAAFTEVARMHGVVLPVDPRSDAWVDWDPDERVPLYWPEAAGADEHASSTESATTHLDPAAKPLGTPPEQPDQAPIRSEGQRAIDKLVDRLRDAGRGLEAARLVTEHQGYGSDPNAARELYARLRQLLLDGRST